MWSGLRITATSGANASMRAQAARADGGGSSGSSTIRAPREATANDETSGSQSLPSCQAGCGWRHSHSPSATSRSSTAMRGEDTVRPRASPADVGSLRCPA